MERPNLTPAQKSMMRAIIITVVLVSIMIFLSVGMPKPKEQATPPASSSGEQQP